MTEIQGKKKADSIKTPEKIFIDSQTPFARSRRFSSVIEKDDIAVYRDAVVLLPHNTHWKMLFSVSLLIHMMLVMYNVGYSRGERIIFVYLFDMMFIMDWILHLLLIIHPEKEYIVYKKRRSLAMALDLFTMIPLEFFDHSLEILRVIRVYRILIIFPRRRTRTGHWPVCQKIAELVIIVGLIGCIGGRLLYGVTCEKVVHVGCAKLLLTFRFSENFTEEKSAWYWYTKSQYLMIKELTRAGFPYHESKDAIDEIVVFFFIVFHFSFLVYRIMPLTATAFLEKRRNVFTLSSFLPFLTAILQVHNQMNLLPRTIAHYRQVRGRRGVPAEISGFKDLPQTLQTEISMNRHWEMIRSTSFFRVTNMNVRRNLALIAQTCYIAAGHVVVNEGDSYDRMMFIINGTVVFMKGEEDIVYFEKGTSFGGANLFYKTQSPFTIKCVTYCEFDFIEREAFQNLADENTEVREQCTVAIRDRIGDAQEIKRMADQVKRRVSVVSVSKLSPIVWLERRFHDLKNKTPKAKDAATEETDLHEFLFTDKYINDFVFSPSKRPTHQFLQKILQPGSTFLNVWSKVSSVIILISAFLFPYFACQEDRITKYFIIFTGILIFSYLVDFCLYLISPIETNEGVITNPIKILSVRCRQFIFYVDIITFFPVFALFDTHKTIGHPLIAIATSIHCLKICKIFYYSRMRHYEDIRQTNGWSVIKLIIIFLYPMWLWNTALYALTCTYESCGTQSWATYRRMPMVSVLQDAIGITTVTATGVSFWNITFKSVVEFVLVIIGLIIFCAIFVYVYGDIASRLTLERSHILRFENFRQQIIRTMSEKLVRKDLQLRGTSCVDAIGSVTNYHLSAYQKKGIQYLPKYISKMIFKDPIVEMIRQVKLFRNCSEALINELLDIAKIHILPPGEIVVIAGHISTHLFIIDEGLCKYLKHSPPVLLRKGDVFPLVETLGHFAVLNTVKCLTFCRLIALDYYTFQGFISKYSDFGSDTEEALRRTLTPKYLKELENVFSLMEDTPSSDLVSVYKRTSYLFSSKQDPRGKILHSLVRFFSIDAILPHGYFMIYMEIMRILFSIISGFVFPVRRLVGLYYYANYLYIILVLDVTAYIDIFIRLRHAYHDKNGNLVTSPLKICLHYLTRSLIVDLYACFPFDFLFQRFLQTGRLSSIQAILYLNRVVQVYRMRQIPSIQRILKFKPNIILSLIFYTVFCLIVFNALASYTLFTGCDMYESSIACETFSNFSSLHFQNNPMFCYIYHMTWFVSILVDNGCEGFLSRTLDYTLMIFLVNSSYILKLLIYCVFTSYHDFTEFYISLVDNNQKTALMIDFMKEGKIKSKTRKAVLEYYCANWIRTKNLEIVPLFKILHPSLCIEILFNIYGEKLRKCQILSDLGDEAIRVILPLARYIHATKKSRLCRVNDILNETLILVNGSVLVEGPGHEVFAAYDVGMMFGNIEPVKWNRQSVTIIAVDHVEVLAFPTLDFFQRLRMFPLFEDVMELYTQYHVDYIPPGAFSSGDRSATLGLIKQKERERVTQDGCVTSFLKKYLHVPYNPSHIGWKIQEIIVLIVSLIVYIVVWSQIGFRHVSEASSVVVYLSDVLEYWVIFYKAHCAYYNAYGELVTGSYAIMDRYCHSRELVIDVISLVPLDIVYLANGVEYITSWTRLNRCLRIRDIFIYLEIKPNRLNKRFTMKRIIHTIIVVVGLLIPLATLYLLLHPESEANLELFTKGLVASLHVFAMADWECTETTSIMQLVYLVIVTLVTQALWMYSGIQFFSITRSLYYSKESYARKSHALNRYLRHRKVPNDLVEEAWARRRFLWFECEGESEPIMVGQAPNLMRQLIKYTVYGPLIRKHGFYRHLHRDFLRQMIDKVVRRIYFPGNIIVLSGIADHCTYFISWGAVEEIVENADLSQEKTRDLHGGDVFGIVQGVFPESVHRHSYRAITKCHILILKYDDWCHLLDFFPAAKYEMYHSANSMYIFSVD